MLANKVEWLLLQQPLPVFYLQKLQHLEERDIFMSANDLFNLAMMMSTRGKETSASDSVDGEITTAQSTSNTVGMCHWVASDSLG